MAKVNTTFIQNYELKFKQMGAEGVNQVVKNMHSAVQNYVEAAKKGQGLGIGMGPEAKKQAQSILEDLKAIEKKQQEVLANPSAEGYEEILRMTDALEKKLVAGLDHAFKFGTVFQEGGKDVKTLNANLDDLNQKLQDAEKRSEALKQNLQDKKKNLDTEISGAKAMGLDPKKIKTKAGVDREIDRVSGMESETPEEEEKIKKQLEFLYKIKAVHEETSKAIQNTREAQKLNNEEIKKYQKEIDIVEAQLNENSSA